MRELAERSGVDVQRLRQLINLGILSPDAAGRFQPADTQPPPCCPRWNAPIAFLDLTGYTTLTEERGDRAVADLAARLVELVATVAHQHGGRPVKLLGDGVMFCFPEPAQAVVAGLELVQRIPDQGLPRARVGVNSGPVVLVSDAVVTATTGPHGVRYQPIGPIALKGVTTPVTLHTAVPAQ